MYRPPVRIEYRREVDELAADEPRKNQNDCRQWKREGRDQPELPSSHHEQCGNTSPEGECQAKVVQICERHVTECPRHICRASALLYEDIQLAIVSSDPAHEPACEVEENACGRRAQPEPLGKPERRIEVR